MHFRKGSLRSMSKVTPNLFVCRLVKFFYLTFFSNYHYYFPTLSTYFLMCLHIVNLLSRSLFVLVYLGKVQRDGFNG